MGDCSTVLEDSMQTKLVAEETTRPTTSHYQQGKIEPIDFINSQRLNFNLGNAIKYVTRCNYKGTKKEDLMKAKAYIDFELELM